MDKKIYFDNNAEEVDTCVKRIINIVNMLRKKQ